MAIRRSKAAAKDISGCGCMAGIDTVAEQNSASRSVRSVIAEARCAVTARLYVLPNYDDGVLKGVG